MPVNSTSEPPFWQDEFFQGRSVPFETLPLRPQGLFCTTALPPSQEKAK